MTRFVLAAVSMLAAGQGAASEAAADFYQGKTITIITSTGEGGGYDAIARSIGRQLTKHIHGNPNTVVQNMPGGGHMLATNHLYSIAPKDRTVIGTVNHGQREAAGVVSLLIAALALGLSLVARHLATKISVMPRG